jgi:FlaA1/EpsC-like NDP-sugar epimerase
MTIPEASSLVLKAGGINVDADMLILDMGEPLSIREMVEQMIRFYGYEPGRDIPIEITGLRPGEKLHEKLIADGEAAAPSTHPKILELNRNGASVVDLDEVIESLRRVCFFDPDHPQDYRNRIALKRTLHTVIPTLDVPEDEPEY